VLHDFLTLNRAVLIERCKAMVTSRSDIESDLGDALHGIPIFLDQLTRELRLEQLPQALKDRFELGIATADSDPSVKDSAALHGRDLLNQGFSLEQVVRAYGDVCQAVTNLAFDTGAPIEVDEFRTFNRCLDNAIASAVTEYSQAETSIATEASFVAISARLGPLAHELRNSLQSATLAFKVIKSGNVGATGATGLLIDKSLTTMRYLIDRSLSDVRVTAGLMPRFETINLSRFLTEAVASAMLDPASHRARMRLGPIDESILVHVDPEMLSSAVANLLQNAIKFTQRDTEIRVDAYKTSGQILIEVEDHCGGLPAGTVEKLMTPFHQSGKDRSGLGLGLDICRRAAEANNGTLTLRDLPGSGCVFVIGLPLASAGHLAVS
jgi:signal transduction histidine kinase